MAPESLQRELSGGKVSCSEAENAENAGKEDQEVTADQDVTEPPPTGLAPARAAIIMARMASSAPTIRMTLVGFNWNWDIESLVLSSR